MKRRWTGLQTMRFVGEESSSEVSSSSSTSLLMCPTTAIMGANNPGLTPADLSEVELAFWDIDMNSSPNIHDVSRHLSIPATISVSGPILSQQDIKTEFPNPISNESQSGFIGIFFIIHFKF